MYNPKKFLTKEILIEVLECYKWKENYEISEGDCSVDGIKVRFPKCILFFREGFESDMSLYLGDPYLRSIKYWSSFELINYVFVPELKVKGKPSKPKYLEGLFPFSSSEKVKFELNNLCIAIQYYLQDCLSGDFSWIDDIQKNKSNS